MRPLLLVEDNPDDEFLTTRALRQANVANPIEVARDGEEALDFLLAKGAYAERDAGVLPQVVLLDLKLPKLSGIEVLERIRSDPSLQRIPVVVLTSSDLESDITRCYELGVNSFVPKPVKFEEFAKAVQQIGLYWALLNEAPPA